jgi:hypothetical protein
MKKFAEMFDDIENLQAPLADLPCYHLQTLMDKTSDNDSYLWYTRLKQGFMSAKPCHHPRANWRVKPCKISTETGDEGSGDSEDRKRSQDGHDDAGAPIKKKKK